MSALSECRLGGQAQRRTGYRCRDLQGCRRPAQTSVLLSEPKVLWTLCWRGMDSNFQDADARRAEKRAVLVGRRNVLRRSGTDGLYDSPLEGTVRCELVSAAGPDSGPDEYLESIKKGASDPFSCNQSLFYMVSMFYLREGTPENRRRVGSGAFVRTNGQARGPRTLEGPVSGSGVAAARGRCPRRLDARPIDQLDSHPDQSAQHSRGRAPAGRSART